MTFLNPLCSTEAVQRGLTGADTLQKQSASLPRKETPAQD